MATLIRSFLADDRGATAMDVVVVALLITAVLYATVLALATEIESTIEVIRGTLS